MPKLAGNKLEQFKKSAFYTAYFLILKKSNDYGSFGSNDVVEVNVLTTLPDEDPYSFYVIFEIFFANLVTEDFKMTHNLLDPPPAPAGIELIDSGEDFLGILWSDYAETSDGLEPTG